MNITTALLDFLMNLLRNPDAAAEFREDPEGVLEGAGLGGVCSEDVDAVMPVILDWAPVGNREYNTGGNVVNGGGNGGGGHHHGGGKHHDNDHGHAVQQISHVVNNYSYTSVDDRDNIVDQSVNQNIWADGDVTQLFNNEAIIASGDHAVAAGDDAEVDNSTNTSIIVEDSFNEETNTWIEDSFNEDNSVEIDVEIEDSFNDESVTVEDSFNEETNIDVEIEDSFNEDNSVDNSVNTEIDVEIEDSFNEDNSTNTEIDVEIEDSFNEVVVEDSFNEVNTDIAIEEIDIEYTDIDDSTVIDEVNVDADVDVVVEAPVLP